MGGPLIGSAGGDGWGPADGVAGKGEQRRSQSDDADEDQHQGADNRYELGRANERDADEQGDQRGRSRRGAEQLAEAAPDQKPERGRAEEDAGEQKDQLEQDERNEQNRDCQQDRERDDRDAAKDAGRCAQARMVLQAIEHHPRAQRKDQEDQQGEQIPGEPPEQPVIGHQRIVRRLARSPRNDRLRHGSADLIDLPGYDAAGSRVVGAADHVDVAFDDAGDRRVAEDHGEIARDDLTRFDHDRTEVCSAVVDGLRVGERRRRQRQCREKKRHGCSEPDDHERSPRTR